MMIQGPQKLISKNDLKFKTSLKTRKCVMNPSKMASPSNKGTNNVEECLGQVLC